MELINLFFHHIFIAKYIYLYIDILSKNNFEKNSCYNNGDRKNSLVNFFKD